MTGLYIHIPFCEAICHYCDFVKRVPKSDAFMDEYLDALLKEITNMTQEVKHLDTIYIGGGTPSILNLAQIERLLKPLQHYQVKEYTFEVNPESYTFEKGLLLKKMGVNRISLGVQTFDQDHLIRLNRKHTNQMVFDAIKHLKSIQIGAISVDLIYALENQTTHTLKADLQMLIDLNIDHISAYSLILEKNTYFHYQYNRNQFKPLDEDTEATMYDMVIDTLSDHGFHHYEISNFSKPGFESLHNMLYWTQQPYIGLGTGAHGFDGTYRTVQTKAMGKYLKGEPPQKMFQDEVTLRNDHLLFLLRMTKGIDLSMVKSRYKKDIFDLYPSLHKVHDDGLVEVVNHHLRLTRRGLQLGNLVFMVFI